MADDFQKVVDGQQLRIPAKTYNAFIDAAKAERFRQSGGGSVDSFFREKTVVKIRNDSGADRNRFEVLGLDVPFITFADNEDSFKQWPNFIGVEPEADHAGKFAILLEPIPEDGYGDGMIIGVTATELSVTASGDTHADVEAGQYKLKTGTSGAAKILWKESGTGAKWGIIAIGSGGGSSSSCQIIRLTTSTKDGAGYQDGKVSNYDTATNTWSDGETVLFRNWYSAVAAFTSGQALLCVKVGEESGVSVYAAPFNLCP